MIKDKEELGKRDISGYYITEGFNSICKRIDALDKKTRVMLKM